MSIFKKLFCNFLEKLLRRSRKLKKVGVFMDFVDLVLSSILFFLFLMLIFINRISIGSLENRIELLEGYNKNVCSEYGQVLNN